MNEMKQENHAYISFDAKSVNESFARMVVMAFMTEMNPTLDELEDVKTAVSEAVTNAIIHGYNKMDEVVIGESTERKQPVFVELPTEQKKAQVELSCRRMGQKLSISVVDHGIGMEDVEMARQPFFTTKPEQERSGMGFSFMETFMDEVDVYSKPGEGTRVTMIKYIGRTEDMSLEACEK